MCLVGDVGVEGLTLVVAGGEGADVGDDRGSRENTRADVSVEEVPNRRPERERVDVVRQAREGGLDERERGSTSARRGGRKGTWAGSPSRDRRRRRARDAATAKEGKLKTQLCASYLRPSFFFVRAASKAPRRLSDAVSKCPSTMMNGAVRPYFPHRAPLGRLTGLKRMLLRSV